MYETVNINNMALLKRANGVCVTHLRTKRKTTFYLFDSHIY